MNKIRIVFFGTPGFAIPVLKELLDSKYGVVAAFTGNGPIEIEAKESGVKVFKPTSLKKDEKVFEEFKSLNPDICVVAAYGKIIPPRYLSVPKYGFLNVHPSLLPKYRGPSPVQTAILNGDPAPSLSADRQSRQGRDEGRAWGGAGTETGVTIMLMDEKIDHGPILTQKPYYLLPTTYNIQASEELFTLGAKLLVEILSKYINGELKPREQDHGQATFTKMFSREDSRINWEESAEKIYNRIRALNPEPGTWTIWRGKIINIKAASVETSANRGKPALKLKIVQLEGKKEMPFKEFLNGYPDFDVSQLN